MIRQLTPDDWNALTVQERAHFCRDQAGFLQRLARDAPDNAAKDGCLRLANEWLQLAIEVESSKAD